MSHFVPIPPDREYWVPKLSKLAISDANGTASIAVWGLPPNSDVLSDSGSMGVAQRYNTKGDLSFFYLRGFKAGDSIAVFQTVAGNLVQQTAWLEITRAAGDHVKAQRDAGTLPRSQHKSNFILDPNGAEQRHPPVKESQWIAAVDKTIATIKANSIGAIVLGSLIDDITIAPYVQNDENANSAVHFTPQDWAGRTEPGCRVDEILFHELCHVLEKNFDKYDDVAVDGLHFDDADFFTVMTTNVYASVAHRPLRRDHRGFKGMIALYASPTTGVAALKTNHAANFASIKSRMPAISRVFGNARATWNPFK